MSDLVRNSEDRFSRDTDTICLQDERDRIESQGGFVMLMGDLWRVGGNIAVSRAIGKIQNSHVKSNHSPVLFLHLVIHSHKVN